MGQAKFKQMQRQIGNQAVSDRGQGDNAHQVPPLGNTGGKDNDTVTEGGNPLAPDRLRVNLSVPEGLHGALGIAAKEIGTSVAQVALMAIVAGLPTLATCVEVIKGLRSYT